MQTTGCLQRYSPSIPSAAQTEDGCLWSLHLLDLFYSSQFKLTYCSRLLRGSEKRENLKEWSVSAMPGSPSQRATAGQHPGKSPPLMGERWPHRSLPEATAFQGWNPPQTTTAIPPACSQGCRCTQKMYGQGWMQKPQCCLTRAWPYQPGSSCPSRRGHMAPGPKPLCSKDPGLNQGEGIKATQPALGKRHPQRAAQWGLGQGGQIQLSTSCK